MFADNIIILESATSTNAVAQQMLQSNKMPEGSVIITHHQTNGKGLGTNAWESEPRKNLTFSIVLYPTVSIEAQFYLNKSIALGIYDYVKAEAGMGTVKIKWPNDIYVNRKKICGILIENAINSTHIEHCIVGIGININQQIFLSNAPNPVSLSNITGKTYNLDCELHKVLNFIEKRYINFGRKKYDEINNEYVSCLFRLNEMHDYIIHEKTVKASITGVTKYGALLLTDTAGKTWECGVKEIRFLLGT